MEKKRKKIHGSDTDKAIAKVGSSDMETLRTDHPLAEKDEVKEAEEAMRKRLNKNKH